MEEAAGSDSSMPDGVRFERVCAAVLRNRGFKDVVLTGGSGDQGADILCSKKGLRYAIQCKYYQGPVGNHAVQEAFAAANYYTCDVAAVMTNSSFTPAAIRLAESTGVELWDNSPTYASRKRNPLVFWISLFMAIGALAYLDYKIRDPKLYVLVPFIWLVFITIYVLATARRR